MGEAGHAFDRAHPGVRRLLDGVASGGSALVHLLVHGRPSNDETRTTVRVERHRYRDSNPGFRTENPAS